MLFSPVRVLFLRHFNFTTLTPPPSNKHFIFMMSQVFCLVCDHIVQSKYGKNESDQLEIKAKHCSWLSLPSRWFPRSSCLVCPTTMPKASYVVKLVSGIAHVNVVNCYPGNMPIFFGMSFLQGRHGERKGHGYRAAVKNFRYHMKWLLLCACIVLNAIFD